MRTSCEAAVFALRTVRSMASIRVDASKHIVGVFSLHRVGYESQAVPVPNWSLTADIRESHITGRKVPEAVPVFRCAMCYLEF